MLTAVIRRDEVAPWSHWIHSSGLKEAIHEFVLFLKNSSTIHWLDEDYEDEYIAKNNCCNHLISLCPTMKRREYQNGVYWRAEDLQKQSVSHVNLIYGRSRIRLYGTVTKFNVEVQVTIHIHNFIFKDAESTRVVMSIITSIMLVRFRSGLNQVFDPF